MNRELEELNRQHDEAFHEAGHRVCHAVLRRYRVRCPAVRLERRVMICLAGPIAQMMFQQTATGTAQDLRDVTRYLAQLDARLADAHLERLMQETRDLLQTYSAAVINVAGLLISRRRSGEPVTRSDVKFCIRDQPANSIHRSASKMQAEAESANWSARGMSFQPAFLWTWNKEHRV